MSEDKDAIVRLVDALQVYGDPVLHEVCERAAAGYYDDFKSPLATPMVQLVNDLKEHERTDLIARVLDGEFDSDAAASAAWMEKEGVKHLSGEHPSGAADIDKVMYLTRRLFHLWKYLMSDDNVDYSRADLLMASHNLHAWLVSDMLDDDAGVSDEVRRMLWLSATQTFEARCQVEIDKLTR